ncbi:MAG: cupin domain-containing protein [bacterium]|nr:cupin domain-containing protein [bacterium]
MKQNVIVLVALLLFAAVAVAEGEKIGAPAPVRLDADKLAGLGLEEFEPFPKEIVLSGRSKHSYHTIFSGEEVVVEVYEAEPAKLKIDEPWPYDEFILVLSGKLVLTDARGKVTQFVAGESLVVPKGFVGIWEMQGNFRELVVIEKTAYDSAEESE